MFRSLKTARSTVTLLALSPVLLLLASEADAPDLRKHTPEGVRILQNKTFDDSDEARREIEARGEMPMRIRVALTPAELAEKSDFTKGAAGTEPDAAGEIPRDESGLIGVESAVAFDTSSGKAVASKALTNPKKPVGRRKHMVSNDPDIPF